MYHGIVVTKANKTIENWVQMGSEIVIGIHSQKSFMNFS